MVKLGSAELGSRFRNNRDVIASQILADQLFEKGQFEQADKVSFVMHQYVEAWNSVINALSGEFPVRVYDENVMRWRDETSGVFVKSPFNDDAFRNRAVELRLIEDSS